ncbi:MAG: efflux RND transporter periplasmic adaptor subunit [Gemmatimonadota bacterium]|jgi:membrane fusion protein (multidrug efflux system)
MTRAWKLGILALTVIACGAACGRDDAARAQGAGGRGQGGPDAPGRVTPVSVAPVERGSVGRSVTVSGVVEPIRIVGVNSQISGALLAVLVEEGNVVRKGGVLARVDDRELQAQLEAAEASYQVTQAAYERAQQLRDRKVITLPEYERDRTAFAAAKAQLEQVRTRIAYATVTAPIDGVITEKRVEAGDVVAPQTRLFTLADVSTLVVRVGVSELDVVAVNVGDPVVLALDAFPDRSFRGRVRRIFPTGDPTTRLVPVEVALRPQDADDVRPGFLARVTFALGTRQGVLLVPASALVGGAGSESVFVVEDGRAIRRTVTAGVTSEGRVEIVAGLQAGEQVIVAGNNMLRDGAAVRVIEDDATAPAEPATRAGEGAA